MRQSTKNKGMRFKRKPDERSWQMNFSAHAAGDNQAGGLFAADGLQFTDHFLKSLLRGFGEFGRHLVECRRVDAEVERHWARRCHQVGLDEKERGARGVGRAVGVDRRQATKRADLEVGECGLLVDYFIM